MSFTFWVSSILQGSSINRISFDFKKSKSKHFSFCKIIMMVTILETWDLGLVLATSKWLVKCDEDKKGVWEYVYTCQGALT